jgi:RHS repeat-associated protein
MTIKGAVKWGPGTPVLLVILLFLTGWVLGEYGASANDVKAEFIWMSPMAGDGGSFGGDDGLGGYMPLAVAVPDSAAPGATLLAWVHANHMGVPIRYSDAAGQTLTPPTGYSVPGFPGQSQTSGLGGADLYYNRYRDYDPTTGRYIQADPIGLEGGPSPYSYALNSPLKYSDPKGLCFWDGCIVEGIVIGAVVGAGSDLAIQAATNWWQGNDVFDANCYDWGQVGAGFNAARAGGRVATGAVEEFDDLLRVAQRQYPNKAGNIEIHHIEPIYLGGAKNGATAPLDAAYHQMITNAFRREHPYGIGQPSAERVREIMDIIYHEFPLPPL